MEAWMQQWETFRKESESGGTTPLSTYRQSAQKALGSESSVSGTPTDSHSKFFTYHVKKSLTPHLSCPQ